MGRVTPAFVYIVKSRWGYIELPTSRKKHLTGESEANEGVFLFLMARRLAWRNYLKDYGGQRQEKKQKPA
jgi:hypothetical protein